MGEEIGESVCWRKRRQGERGEEVAYWVHVCVMMEKRKACTEHADTYRHARRHPDTQTHIHTHSPLSLSLSCPSLYPHYSRDYRLLGYEMDADVFSSLVRTYANADMTDAMKHV